MNPICMERIKKNIIYDKFITETQYEKCLSIYETCQSLNIPIHFLQILLLCHRGSEEGYQRFLHLLLQEFTPGIVMNEIDPFSTFVGPEWYLRDIDLGLVEADKLSECYELAIELQKDGIMFNLSEVMLFKEYFPEHLLHQSITSSPPLSWKNESLMKSRVDLRILKNQRWRNKELLPPVLSIVELSNMLFPASITEECIQLSQKNVSQTNINLTPIQVLNRKFFVDPHLVHALIISNIKLTPDGMEIWMGDVLVKKVLKVKSTFASRIFGGRGAIQEFLEWTYQIGWLTFSKEENEKLEKHWAKYISAETFSEPRNIQQRLGNQGLNLSLTAILFWRGLINKEQLMEGVKCCQLESPDMLSEQTILKISEAFPGLILKDKPVVLQAKAEGSEAKAEESQAKVDESTVESDSVTGYILLKKNMINEERLSECLMSQIDQYRDGNQKSLKEVIIEKGILSKEEIEKAIMQQEGEPKDDEKKEEKTPSEEIPSKEDIALGKLISQYNILSSQETGRCLTFQRKLKEVGIFRSLEEILTSLRLIHPDMLQSLIDECLRRKTEINKKTESHKKEVAGYSHIKASPSVSPKISTVILHNKIKSKKLSIGMAFAFLLVVIYILIPTSRPQKKKPLPEPVSQKEKVPLPLLNNPPQPYKEPRKMNVLTSDKGERNLRWGNIWITPQEKKQLSQTWTPQKENIAKFSPELSDAQAQYTPEKGIIVQGKVTPSPLRSAVFHLVLHTPLVKNKIYAEKWENLPLGEVFTFNLGLARPLLKGRYLLRLLLEPSSQDSKDRRLLDQTYSWVIPLAVGNEEDFKKALNEDIKELNEQMVEVYAQVQVLQKKLKEPSPLIKKDWQSWSKKWEDRQRLLEDRVNSYQSQALIPRFPETEEALFILMTSLRESYEKLSLWAKGVSLIPPQFSGDQDILEEKQRALHSAFSQEKSYFPQRNEKK